MPKLSVLRPSTSANGDKPRGLGALELWQTDITHYNPFGRLKYLHVSIDTFSGAVFASLHTGEKTKDIIRHLFMAFATLGVPKAIKTDNGPGFTSARSAQFLQQWGIAHSTGIPHNPTGQAIVERSHKELKRLLEQQHDSALAMTPVERLCKALYVLNFLNCSDREPNPPALRHFCNNTRAVLKERPPVLIRDPESKTISGPYPLITWGRGYACISTAQSLKWIPGNTRMAARTSFTRKEQQKMSHCTQLIAATLPILLWLHVADGWVVPQPKENIWITLAKSLQQDNLCLAMGNVDNPLSTCLVGVPLIADDWPVANSDLLRTTGRRPNPVDTWDEWTKILPNSKEEPQELDLLGSSTARYCVKFYYRRPSQNWHGIDLAKNTYRKDVTPISKKYNSQTWCNYTTQVSELMSYALQSNPYKLVLLNSCLWNKSLIKCHENSDVYASAVQDNGGEFGVLMKTQRLLFPQPHVCGKAHINWTCFKRNNFTVLVVETEVEKFKLSMSAREEEQQHVAVGHFNGFDENDMRKHNMSHYDGKVKKKVYFLTPTFILFQRRIKWFDALKSRQEKDSRIDLEANPWKANRITLATLRRKKKKDLDRLEGWAEKKLLKFNEDKCRALHRRRNNPRHQRRLGLSCWKEFRGEGPGVPHGQQTVHEPAVCPGAKKANGVLECIRKSTASRLREDKERDMELLEQIQ
ncbi:Pol polyprotein [Lonchura striata]|uniref:Pol polyprotein n=1 Tax=Lonchura striata TaxID=40157 RepID=A0A218UG14_9PASE|nr:Pol polyprotein [Lonchura striata domestica]